MGQFPSSFQEYTSNIREFLDKSSKNDKVDESENKKDSN